MSEIKPVMFAMNLCEKCRDIKIVGDSCIGCKYRKVVEAKVEMNLELVTEIQQLQARLKEADKVIKKAMESNREIYDWAESEDLIPEITPHLFWQYSDLKEYQQKYKDKE